jgi:RimJ/RimL family protein N-acetyltransferase
MQMEFCGTAPRIETARLVMSGHGAADFEDVAAMWADPDVVRYIRPVSDRHESWMRVLSYAGCWPVLGYGYWCVREKATGRYAGDLGFADLHRGVEPSIDGVPEAGWVFNTWAHGQGLASEALQAALDWLDTATHYRRSVCLIDPENAASLKLAGRCGFVDAVRIAFKGEDTVLLTRVNEAVLF